MFVYIADKRSIHNNKINIPHAEPKILSVSIPLEVTKTEWNKRETWRIKLKILIKTVPFQFLTNPTLTLNKTFISIATVSKIKSEIKL